MAVVNHSISQFKHQSTSHQSLDAAGFVTPLSRHANTLRSRLTVSVIVCAHNEEAFVAACLHSLLAQTRIPDEILLIDNASTDRTGQVARNRGTCRAQDSFGAVVALTSQLRRREFAIHVALGARRQTVRKLVLKEGLRLAALGTVAGVALAAAGTRGLEGLLHGVEPLDRATFVAAGAVVLALAGVSALMPAMRAGRVDPAEALKAE